MSAVEDHAEWLQQCGPCDFGLPFSCVCPEGDARSVILSLARRVDELEARLSTLTPSRDDDVDNTGADL